jgi:hypothetical protein
MNTTTPELIDARKNNVPYIGGYSTTDLYNGMRKMPPGTILDAGALVHNSNTYTATTGEHLQPDAVEKALATFAPINVCNRVFDPDPFKPYSSNHVKYCSAGTTTLTGSTGSPISTFQPSNGNTVDDVQVSITHFCQPWHVTNSQFQSGARIEDALAENLLVLGQSVVNALCANFTTSNFSQTHTAAEASFALSDAAKVHGLLKKSASKALILDSQYFSNLSHTAGFDSGTNFGWSGGIYQQSAGWSSAGSKVRGVGLCPQAVLVVTGVLLPMRTQIVKQSFITLGQTGLVIEYNRWLSTADRVQWASLDLVFGTGVADGAAAVLVLEP